MGLVHNDQKIIRKIVEQGGRGISLLAAIQMHLDRRAGGAFRVGAVLFSNQHGPLGETKTAKELMQEWQN